MPQARKVAIVTLGCARNEVDSDELAGMLREGEWQLVDSPDEADAVLVNTCGFITEAKRESIETVLSLKSDQTDGQAVIAVGCLAERYGRQLAEELPEADAVLGFDDYPQINAALERVLSGEPMVAHDPRDRRKLLPISPVDRHSSGQFGQSSQSGSAPEAAFSARRHRLDPGPLASLKIASGCDRRCAFCSIPSFRGAFVSRPQSEIISEALWLADQGAQELLLVSENTTSYGRGLAGVNLVSLLQGMGDALSRRNPIRIRLSYLQPKELTRQLIGEMAANELVAPYFDVSFQHASAGVLRRMRRFGSADEFIDLIGAIRSAAPGAGIRSNFIVGFPGESDDDVDELLDFLGAAQLDAVGVFGYSDEEGTEAFTMGDKIAPGEIRARVDRTAAFAEQVAAERAESRIGDRVEVLIERAEDDRIAFGRAGHQGPEDGETEVHLGSARGVGGRVSALVQSTGGVDLVATEVTP